MTTPKIVVLLFGVGLLVSSGRCVAQERDDSPQCSTVYENRNQIDYGPLKVRAAEGRTVIQVGNQEQAGAPGACFALFTEKDHKLVASVKADARGRFGLENVAPATIGWLHGPRGFARLMSPLRW